MPDGRMLSKSISHSVQLGEVSMEADYLFARCIPHLDCEGRMTGHPALVKATACPLRPEITVDAIPDLLRQLSGAGLVRWYEAQGKQVLEFPGFKNHQRGTRFDREAPSRYPEPPSESTPDLLRTNSGPGAAKGEVEVEVKAEVEVEDPPGVAHAREPLESEVEVAEVIDDELPEVPADTGARVVPIRPKRTDELPFSGHDWQGRVSGNVVLAEWIRLQPTPPSRSDRDRYGRAARQLADEHSTGEIALAFMGMSYLWPYGDPKTGSPREPWTPEDLRRVFAKALPAAQHHPQAKQARYEAEFAAAEAEGGPW